MEKLYPIFGVILGGLITLLIQFFYNNMRLKQERTKQFIDEFYSKEFIIHRISVWETSQNVLANKVSLEHIAIGYIYPLEKKCYEGKKIKGLTEHEHLTIYFGFFERLSHAIKNNDVDKKLLKNTFQYEFLWNNDFFMNLANCGNQIYQRRKKENSNFLKPYFIESIETIEKCLNKNPYTQQRIKFDNYYENNERPKFLTSTIGYNLPNLHNRTYSIFNSKLLVSNNGLTILVISIIAFAILTLLIFLFLYLFKFPNGFSPLQADWANFGSYLGGTTAPILSFLTLIAFLYTIILQNTELEETRKELKLSRESQEKQAICFDSQIQFIQLQDKRNLTLKMHTRWVENYMRKHRLNAWNELHSEWKNQNIPLKEFLSNSKDKYISFTEVAHFFSDLNKMLSENLLDSELTLILLQDSITPWFEYTDRLIFDTDFDNTTKKWYQEQVITLKKHFVNN